MTGNMRNRGGKTALRSLLPVLVLCLFVVTSAWGDVKEGVAAYERGDYKTALDQLRPLAEQGDADAQYHLGAMYDLGKGVVQDDVTAVKWYTKAAQQNHASAQNNLGVMYEYGEGVVQDYVMAHVWYNLAAAHGNKKARENRDTVARKMTRDQIAEAQRLAREWKPVTARTK